MPDIFTAEDLNQSIMSIARAMGYKVQDGMVCNAEGQNCLPVEKWVNTGFAVIQKTRDQAKKLMEAQNKRLAKEHEKWEKAIFLQATQLSCWIASAVMLRRYLAPAKFKYENEVQYLFSFFPKLTKKQVLDYKNANPDQYPREFDAMCEILDGTDNPFGIKNNAELLKQSRTARFLLELNTNPRRGQPDESAFTPSHELIAQHLLDGLFPQKGSEYKKALYFLSLYDRQEYLRDDPANGIKIEDWYTMAGMKCIKVSAEEMTFDRLQDRLKNGPVIVWLYPEIMYADSIQQTGEAEVRAMLEAKDRAEGDKQNCHAVVLYDTHFTPDGGRMIDYVTSLGCRIDVDNDGNTVFDTYFWKGNAQDGEDAEITGVSADVFTQSMKYSDAKAARYSGKTGNLLMAYVE